MNHHELALVLARIDLENSPDPDLLIETVRRDPHNTTGVLTCEWRTRSICDELDVVEDDADLVREAYPRALREVCA